MPESVTEVYCMLHAAVEQLIISQFVQGGNSVILYWKSTSMSYCTAIWTQTESKFEQVLNTPRKDIECKKMIG